jgi:CDGSH-type Zn-finger protein
MNTATLTPDGPYELRGDLALLAADGTVALRGEQMVLCRCGASNSKPLCDSSHLTNGFRDDGSLHASDTAASATAEGRVTIRARPDGPLMCTGALAVIGSNGRRAVAATTFLCRCGGSRNKPYCDGTHVKIGFSG